MPDVNEIIKSKVEDLDKKIKEAKKLIKVGKEVGIDTTEHELKLNDIEERIKKIKKVLSE